MHDSNFEQQMKEHGGRRLRRNRKLAQSVELVKVGLEIKAGNRKRLKSLAQSRNMPMAECLDRMIEAEWERAQQKAA